MTEVLAALMEVRLSVLLFAIRAVDAHAYVPYVWLKHPEYLN